MEEKEVMIIDTDINEYRIEDCYSTMTVKDLIECLQDLDGDMPIYLKYEPNRGSTLYGSLRKRNIDFEYVGDDEDEDDEELE